MPVKFDIYVDQSVKQSTATNAPVPSNQPAPEQSTVTTRPRFIPDAGANQRFYFDEKKLYPVGGGEYSFEEINFIAWTKKQRQLEEKAKIERKNLELRQRNEELQLQNEELLTRIDELMDQLAQVNNGGPTYSNNRQSIIPQSLQPAQNLDVTSRYGAFDEASVIKNVWEPTGTVAVTDHVRDKFTVPIDQSQYIRDNAATSTPSTNRHGDRRNRRMSRPSMGGSPTLKLTPIPETSRDCNSKSSSSSPGTVKKAPQLGPCLEAIADDLMDIVEGIEKIIE